MLRQEDIDYCATHRKGLSTMIGEDIPTVFFRFETAFQLYHRLFDRLPDALAALGQPIAVKDDNNNKKATLVTVKYLGGANILTNLTSKNLDTDIEFLSIALDKQAFHITFNGDDYQEYKDKQLAQNIKSADPETKAESILRVVYQVRCNIEHSKKHMVQDQCFLVSALTRITQAVTDQLYDKLAGDPGIPAA